MHKTNKYSYRKGDLLTSLKLLLNVVVVSHLVYAVSQSHNVTFAVTL